MIYLIDTHPLIWYIDKNKKLSKKAISTDRAFHSYPINIFY